MPAPRLHAPEEGWSQFSKWSPGILFDQHKSAQHPDGRAWWCWFEAPANPKHPKGIIGELIPIERDLDIAGECIKGWSAPWVPEQKYVTRGLGLLGGSSRFKIDYTAMISDYRQANERYYRRAAQEAGAKNWKAPTLYGPLEFQLEAIVGVPPKSPKLPEAALAGDPWLLGFSTHVNEGLKAILDREQGKVALDEYAPSVPPQKTDNSLIAGLTEEQLSGLLEMLQANKQAKAMRDAKAKKASQSQTSEAA